MAKMIPTVHLNGTSADELLKGYREAAEFVRAARKAVEDTAPNGRDYYPQGEGAFSLAWAEHEARMGRLLDVQRELEALALAVRRQKPAR